METPFSPVSFGKRTVVCYFCDGRKRKTKKQKKNICKTYTHPPHRRLRKKYSTSTNTLLYTSTSTSTKYYITGLHGHQSSLSVVSQVSRRCCDAMNANVRRGVVACVRRAGDEEEERSGRCEEQSETENDLGQTRHHRRDDEITDAQVETVIGASVCRPGYWALFNYYSVFLSFIHSFIQILDYINK